MDQFNFSLKLAIVQNTDLLQLQRYVTLSGLLQLLIGRHFPPQSIAAKFSMQTTICVFCDTREPNISATHIEVTVKREFVAIYNEQVKLSATSTATVCTVRPRATNVV